MIGGREIAAGSRRTERYYEADMNQGSPILGSPLADQDAIRFATALGLAGADLHSLPLQVVSTGLPYLIVPVSRGLERARIMVDDFEERLASVGAKFVYVFDLDAREGRTWDNRGVVEDVATGSAAGPAAAYLAAHGLAAEDELIVINQGRFLGRPSRIAVAPDGRGELLFGWADRSAPIARGVLDETSLGQLASVTLSRLPAATPHRTARSAEEAVVNSALAADPVGTRAALRPHRDWRLQL